MSHPNITARSIVCTGSNQIKIGPTKVYSLTIVWNNDANSINLQDSATGPGGVVQILLKHSAVAVAGDLTSHYYFPEGISFSQGVYYERTNAVPQCTITFQ